MFILGARQSLRRPLKDMSSDALEHSRERGAVLALGDALAKPDNDAKERLGIPR